MAMDTYSILCERLGYPDSQNLRRVLQKLMSPDEARIAVELPLVPNEIALKLGMDEKTVKDMIYDMFQKGAVISTARGNFFPQSIHQIRNSSASNPKLDDVLMPELGDLWETFSQAEWYPALVKMAEQGHPRARVIPALKALEGFTDLLPGEDMEAIVERAHTLAMAPCPCRRQSHRCDKMIDACLQFNKGADYTVTRGTGTPLTKEEAMEAVYAMEYDGLVHHGYPGSHFTTICNCCGDCCQELYPLLQSGKTALALDKSRYEAEIVQAECNGCQDCLDRCWFDAIEMQKSPDSKKLKALVLPEKCFGCGLCVITCPTQAIKFQRVRPDMVIPDPLPERPREGAVRLEEIH